MQRAMQAQTERDMITKANRRRSLKTLFQLPLSSRSPEYSTLSTTTAVGSIPEDIVREIVNLLSPIDILNFSLTSSHLRAVLLPALYDTVVLKSSRKCRITLKMLVRKPEVCRYIKKLAVRPNYYLAWPKPDEFLDEGWVVDILDRIAPKLTSMHTFDWDGLELPKDQLWETLRLKCPELKNVFTNVGTRPLDPETQLFNFSNLSSFSLIVRHGLGGSDLFPPLEDLPERFWTMITKHCPNLEELAICSFSSSTRVFDFERIIDAHWPRLHTLTLGSFGYQADFTLGPPNDVAMGQFLEAHNDLKYIRFLWNFKRWMSPDTIPMHLSTAALPKLDTFIGVYQQLAELPNPGNLETLDLTCEPIYESRIGTLCPILKRLTALTSLDIWTHVFDSSRDHSAFFRSILESVPNLTDFHFMCTTSFTGKPLKQLITQLSLLPSLKRFSLTKGHKYMDESMLDTALHVLKHNPNLKQVNIRWAREKCPNHLKQEGTYDVISSDPTPSWLDKRSQRPQSDKISEKTLKKSGSVISKMTKGSHEVHGKRENGDTVLIWEDCNETVMPKSLPKALMAVERGIPIVGPSFERRYKYELDPQNLFGRMGRTKLVRMMST